MNVFLSWSGERSKRVANMLSDWLSCVIQTCRPWVSTRDIDRGALWFSEINDKLQSTSIGVICLTKENINRPWILFEAGALAKGLNGSRVCTLLIDLKPGEITDPLAQFNHTLPEKCSIYQLVKTLNNSLATGGLNETVLEKVFETYWPQFEIEFNQIISSTQSNGIESTQKQSSPDLMFSSIMEMLQTMNGRLRRLEKESSFEFANGRYFKASKENIFKNKALDILINFKKENLPAERAVNGLVHLINCPKEIAEKLVDDYYSEL